MHLKLMDCTVVLRRKILGIVCLLVIVHASVTAQNYNRKIDWQAATKSIYTIDNTIFNQPTFTNAGHSEEFGLLPIYRENIPMSLSGNVKAEIVNAIYSPASNVDAKSTKFRRF